jgi:ABC-type phosphate/phosphonate transport system substrate-binding protein
MNIKKIIVLLLLLTTFGLAKENLKPFNVAYMANSMTNYSKKDLKIAMNLWLQEISKKAGYKANMYFYDDPKQAAKDLEAGKLDYVNAFPLVFVKYFNLSKLTDGFSGGLEHPATNDFVVLVKNDTKIQSWKDLKNPCVGIQRNDLIMHMYAKYKIHNLHLDIKDYERRSKVILDLFFNKIDVAIVPLRNFTLAKELNPQIAQRIKVLENSKINATNLGFYRKSLDEKTKKDVMFNAIKIYNSAKGKQMMMIYRADKLIQTKLSDLKPVQEFYEKYQAFEKEAKK